MFLGAKLKKGIGYLFLCSNLTQKECFQRKLFGVSKKWLSIVKEIKPESTLFLYNINSKQLIGPFTAASDGGLNLDLEAWKNTSQWGFPAQVRVDWKGLHVVEDAKKRFTFLSATCFRLTEDQNSIIFDALKAAPVFDPSTITKVDIKIEAAIPAAERKFSEVLDDHEIAYMRLSQVPKDFSKVLRDLKAKRPDFLVFAEKPVFIEIKSWVLRYYKPEIEIPFEEVEKLKQLELATRIPVLLSYPIDTHGLEWRGMRPAWIWAKGTKKTTENGEVLAIPVKELEKRKLSFL